MARREGLYEVDGELVSERTPPVRWRALSYTQPMSKKTRVGPDVQIALPPAGSQSGGGLCLSRSWRASAPSKSCNILLAKALRAYMINKRELGRKPMSHDNSAIARLRARLRTDRPAIAMAAHNPLAAKLAAEAGFDAIWGSGFELSASYAV